MIRLIETLSMVMIVGLVNGWPAPASAQPPEIDLPDIDLPGAEPPPVTEPAAPVVDDAEESSGKVDIEAHVVKLNVTHRRPDFYQPWTKSSPQKSSGSGVVLSGGRILTNAHVIMHESQVLVQLREGGDQLPAHVVVSSPEMDLAIVELDDPTPLALLPGLELAENLPETKSRVSVYGYPTGGEDLSVTTGIVSRIEFTSYYFTGAGVRVQVDAALNPGNSGGPAIQNDKIIGLVFSKIQSAENIGYLIPTEEIVRFLDDVEDGTYNGKPLLLDEYQSGENSALREYLQIPSDTTGVVVTRLNPDIGDHPLQKHDVLTHIGPHDVDNQGFVEVRPGLRLRFLYYVPLLTEDGQVEVTILREGESQQAQIPVSTERQLLIPLLKDGYPEYFIYGPLVFTTPTQESIRALGPMYMTALAARQNPLILRMFDRPSEPDEQLVMIATRTFPHRIAQGYSNQPFSIVKHVNGTPVENLKHMAELLRDCKAEFVEFGIDGRGETMVFRRQELEEASEEILVDEGIRYRASESLRSVWKD
ncbi:trypsin-like peptidase domain-containing protein [Aeoliella sp. ICT_H6.2]|uniref:Trypsin-like peptidase domain-containing protein n=1 Tax=Aeoliella straminimaris TaxID=2954799 RepID=A0A9X2FB18_9BACT|nr:trypsin-like peptidase domain-containing protein [Aeoliella straminimaris]MCO6045570.1 trypsin-like peptidase domain-containing protein [Aeoliella straminimaris]